MQGLHGITHQFHAEKQNAETQNNFANPLGIFTFDKHPQAKSYGNHQQRIIGEFEGNQLSRNGCADVGAQNYAHGLRKAQQARLHETDQHHGGGAAGLNHHRHKNAYQKPDDPVAGQGRQD